MKRNEELFGQPTKQSIFAIGLIIFKFIKIIFRQFWYILVYLIFRSGSDYGGGLFSKVILGIALLSMIWGVISYFRFTFMIRNEELLISRGVLQRVKVNIPFDRIQTINFNQNILHRLFNVTAVEINTAGSQKTESSFDALDWDVAKALREFILSNQNEDFLHTDDSPDALDTSSSKATVILSHSFIDLLKIGLTQNHFKSAWLIVIAAFWIYQNVRDIGFNADNYVEKGFEAGLGASIVTIALGVLMLILVATLISLTRSIFTYYDLRLERYESKYKLSSGLFNRKETSVLDSKIQIMEWGDNLLMKLLGFYNVKLKQASSIAVAAKQSITIPGCKKEQVEYLKENWIGESNLGFLDKKAVSPHYLYRKLLYRVIVALVLLCLAISLGHGIHIVFSVLLLIYWIVCSILCYYKSGYAINNGTVYVSSGTFGDRYSIMPIHKIQNTRLVQTPYQYRRNLASLKLYTASGQIEIPYIPFSTASQLNEIILYKVESSKLAWM